VAKLTFLGQMDDGAEYATDGSRVYQLVPGKDRKRAVSVEPEREARVRSMMSARRAEAAGESPDEMPERSVMGDLGRLAMAGGARFVGDIGRVAGLESVERAGDRGAEYWRESVSPETQAEMEKPFLSEEGGIGPGLTSPTKIAGTVAESVLPMGVGMAGGASLARAAIGAGASPAAAGLVGGAIGEGTVAGVMSAGQVSTLIDQIPEDRIALAEPYQQAYHSLPGTMDERARRAQAREIVKRQAMGDVGPLVALATAAFGAPSGMAIGRIIGGETGKSLLSTMVKQGLLEGVVQEAPQSAAEQAIQNRTIQRTADPMQDPNEGLAEAAVGGAVAGTAMGGAMGPLAHAAAREPEPPPPAPRAPPAAPPPVKIAGALPSPTMVVDSQGNAEMASARAQRLQDAERRAREAEQAGDMEGALRIRQESLALLQGEDVPPEAPPPPAAPLALPAPSAPPIITDAQGNAEPAAQREARMVDMERRARAAEMSGDMETAISLRREMHAPQLAPQAPPETLGGDGIDAAFLDPEAIDIMGAPEQTGLSDLDAALSELDALVGAAPRAAPAPPAAGIEVGKGGQLERIEAAPPPPDESAPFDPGAPPAGGMGSTSYDIEQIDAAPAPAPQRALPPPKMVVDREGVAEPQSAADARRREQAARTEQQAADMERRAGELEKAGDTEQAMYLRKIAAGYPDEMTEQARAEASRNGRLPEGLRDPRLAREFYRRHLEGMAGELLKGQNRNVERNEDGDVVRRLPSQNPLWFQSLGMTVAQVQHATKKALAGKKLGKREASAVQAMLDEIRARRTSEEEVDFARQRREEARAARAAAATSLGLPGNEEAGELLDESEYDQSWNGEARSLFELYSEASAIDPEAADDIGNRPGLSDLDAARQFLEVIHGRKSRQGDEESAREQSEGARTEEARATGPEGTADEEVAPPLLETYTEDDLRKRADADKAAAQAKAEEEAKAAADEARGSFTLSGSDREADQAASRGQSGLFDRATSAGGQRGSDNSESAQSVSKRGLGRAEFGANLSQGPSSAEQLDSALGVPRDGPKGSRVDSSVPEGGPNNLVAYSQTLGDLGYADTLMQHGYRALDVPGQARVLKAVLSFIYDSKVLRSIVSAIPVPVMNNLVGPKFSTQDVLDDRAVLIHALATNNDLGVLAAAIDAIVSAPTVSVAEIPLVDFGRATKKRSTAAETFDSDSHEAATSAISDAPLPSKAQRDAGNYRLGHIRIMGLDISIENPEGSIRTGLDANGKPWAVKMKAAYGYIKGTVGKDKDHVDVFVKPMTPENWDGTVFVVDQKKPGNGHFDEHKVMIGYPDLAAAEKAYRNSYTKDWDGIRAITPAPLSEFKQWLASGDTKAPFAKEEEAAPSPEAAAPEAPAQNLNKKHAVETASVMTPSGALKATATNSRAPSSVWFYQGDMGMLGFKAGVTVNGQPDSGAAEARALIERIKVVEGAGWRRRNVRAGRLGTVWVYERGKELLTRAGMEAASSGVHSRPEMPKSEPGYDSIARQQIALASAFSRWLNTLDGEQQSNRGVMSRKMGETPVGEWARLSDEKGGLRLTYITPDGKGEISIAAMGDWDDLRRYVHALADVAAEAESATDIYPVMTKAATAAGVRFSQYEPEPVKPAAPEPKKAAPAPKEDDRQPLIAQYQATMRALHEGTATVEDYKASFRAILEQPEAVKAQIALDSKDAILKGVGPSFAYRYKAEKKDAIVNAAYDAILAGYALGKSYGPTSYFMSRDGLKDHERKKREALAELVESQTDETLAEYAAEVKRTREENAASRAKAVEAIENPKTLDDFRSFMSFHLRNGKSEAEARLSLTPEQRTRYDELWAESTREARETRKREAKTQVRAAGQSVAGGIVETKHTRDGYDLFVVRLEERVSAEDYRTLLSSAKRLGGWYSKFRGNGAVPGWQFKTRESAEAFQKLAGGDTAAAEEVVSARRDAFEDDRSQTAVQRLNEMADRLEERAEESLGRDRKQNTERRARMAASAEAAAQQELALAKTMRNLARSIEAGEAKFLDAVRQKAQVEMLTTLLRNAKDAELRHKYPAYIDYERHRGEPATEETVDFATFPSFTAFRSDLATLGRQLLEVEGTKAMGQSLMKVADDVTDAYIEFAKANFHKVATFARGDQIAKFDRREDAERAIIRSGFRGKAIVLPLKRGENVIVLSPSESINRGIWQGDGDKRITLKREFGMELVEKLGRVNRRKNRVTVPYQFEAAHDRLKSLSRLGIETPAEFRSALREFVRLRELPAPADRVKELERSMIGRQNDGLDFFPTPQSIADQMVEAAELAPGMRVLEPSAGWGHIAERIREAGIDPDVIEVSSKRRELLEAKGFRLVGSDFMDLKGRSGFTYGDIFRAPDGTVGVMRSSGGMGSNRVGLDPLDADGKPDRRRFQWHDFDDLTPVKRKDDPLGAVVPRSDLTALEEARDIVRGDVLSSVRQAIRWYDRGDYAGAAELIGRAIRQAEFNPAALERFSDIETRLNAAAEGQYDRILMNPPFSDGRDIAHVRHAFDLLKPGGRLVAIMGEGAFFQSNKRATEFREWLEEVGGTEEKLPDGAFTDPSLPVTTGVAARMVVIERPPSDGSSQFSNPDSPAFAGLSVSEVENAIGPAVLGVSDAVGMRVNVVASNAELPASVRRDLKPGQRPHGVLTPEGEVFIVAGNMRTLRAARAAFAHEVIGHLGVNQVIGDWDAVRQRIRWLVKSGNGRALEIDADLTRRYPNTDPDTYAREFIALAAERAHDGPVAQLLTRVRAAIRRFLAKLGLRRVFQDWEIDVWLSDSRRYLRTGKRRGSAPQTHVYSMADEREQFLWEVMSTANGPAFQNADITLFPGGAPMAGGWGGANGYSVIDNDTGQKIATLVVSLDGDRVSDIHWIEAAERGRGAGMRTVRSIIANSDTPVRVTSILDDARGFWNKMGAYSYDESSNAYINWETHSGPEEDAGLVQGGAEEAGTGRGEADDSGPEGAEGEVRGPQYSNPSDRFDTKAKDWLADHLKSNKRVSFWSRTVGTMYHLAEKVPQFKAVFDAGQEFLSDVSRIAVEAEGLAPGLFRQMTTVEKAFKTGTASAKDVAAISKAVYAGTLSDQRVYADDELRDKFGLTPAQIGLYRQAIRTAHKSLDDLTLSSIYRMAATLEIPKAALRAARERSAGTEEFMASIYADFLKPARDSLNERAEEIQADIDELEMAERQETDEEALENIRGELSGARAELAEVEKERDGLRKAIEEMYKAKARMEQLKAEGYFPLMRFGKYTVDVESDQIDPDTGRPERIYFGMFETEAEANTMARLMQVEYPRADVSTGIASQDDWRLFPGLTADVVESFARLTGQSENELFQDYIRLAVSNRSAMKRFINRKGVPGFNEDVNRTLATFVLSNARLASSHYHMGEMRKAVDEIPKKMGDVKDMATRLVLYLTNPQEEWAGLRGFMFFHFLGGSLASALTNLTQVPMVTMPWLSQYGARAAAGALKWTRPGTKPTDAAHKEALKRAEDEGIVSPQEVYNLMATARGGSLGAGRVLSSRPVQTALYVWGSLFSAAEQHNRRVTFNAAFELAQKRRERDPYGFAVRAVEQTQFVYNRGNRPAWGRGIGAPLFTFKQFSISYLELLARMPAKQKLLMVALLVLAAGLEGLPFEEDLEDIIDTIAQWNGYAWSTRAELETWAEKHLGRTLGPLLTRGVSGIGIPIDVQARLGLGNLIPGTALGKPSSLDPGKEALEVLGAPGGVLKSLGYAGQSAARGDWYGALWSAAPRAVQNAMKGVQMWQEGQYLDPQQRLVTETTRGAAVAKAIGFHPTTVSDVQRSQRQVDGIVQLHRVTEDGIADTWARGIVFKKPEMVEEARQRLRTWNTDNPGHKIVIAPRQITQRVRTLRLTQRERYLKTVPKELRQQAAERL